MKEKHLEKQETIKSLKFLYRTSCGRFILNLLLKRKWVSDFMGFYYNSRLSKRSIEKFMEGNKLSISPLDEIQDLKDYKSFNDFFYRKRNFDFQKQLDPQNSADFVSPAHSLLSVFKIEENSTFKIKGSDYNVKELLMDEELGQEYNNGYIYIFRLCVHNYHRYHFFDKGVIVEEREIPGSYHTVNLEYSKDCQIFTRNHRNISILETENFGKCIYVEVGALGVGKINNHENVVDFNRLDEKGYFSFGGSTVCVLVKKDTLVVNDEYLKGSLEGYEFPLELGEFVTKKA